MLNNIDSTLRKTRIFVLILSSKGMFWLSQTDIPHHFLIGNCPRYLLGLMYSPVEALKPETFILVTLYSISKQADILIQSLVLLITLGVHRLQMVLSRQHQLKLTKVRQQNFFHFLDSASLVKYKKSY
ncbi:hypothetical protein ACIQ57_10645 [Lysinibacillus xylanilyticus]|uniref:hypothetical protein n=1 Tax=Lysinibacillus xylanilyticus TaxID=582475 RepID=UPI00381946C2